MEELWIGQRVGRFDLVYDVGGGTSCAVKVVSVYVYVHLQALRVIWKMVTDMMVGEVADLPTTFDTPMFWSTSELDELRGTSVVGLSIPVNINRASF